MVYKGLRLKGKGCDLNFDDTSKSIIHKRMFEPLPDEMIEFISVAEKLAKAYKNGTWGKTESEAYMALCSLLAVEQHYLKGRILIASFLQRAHKIKGTGRHLGLNNNQIEAILLNEQNKTMNQKDFCIAMRISPKTYRRVIKKKCVQADDNQRIMQIEARLSGKL